MGHHQTHEEMPDCAMGELKGSLRKCDMAACNAQKDNAVNIGLFVLLRQRYRLQRNAVQIPVLARYRNSLRIQFHKFQIHPLLEFRSPN